MPITPGSIPMEPPLVGWLFEIVGPLVFVGCAAWFVIDGRRRRELTPTALLFVATTTMFWQEWFGDWGGYVLYNSNFALVPWGSSLWVTPNKPWAVIPAYGWFFILSYPPLLRLAERLRSRFPSVRPWVAVVVLGLPFTYLWDLLIEGAASLGGLWSYVDFIGPAIRSPRGNFPLVQPIIMFAVMIITAVIINARDADGRPSLERALQVHRLPSGVVTTAGRIGAWTLTLNACYLALFIGPIVAVRIAVGAPNALVL